MTEEQLQKLFLDPHCQYPADKATILFSDYITECQNLIARTRLDLEKNATKIISANSPFELPVSATPDTGALLIHGLLDSPFTMQELGQCLQAQNILVRSILLPGHGTVPGALLNIHFQQWIDTVRYGLETLHKDVKKIFIVGFSTGALLALYFALIDTFPIAGLILVSPAIRIRSNLAFISGGMTYLSKIWERTAWFYRDPNETIDYAKYQSLPFNAIFQVHQLTKIVKALSKNRKLNTPLLSIQSLNDATVCGKSAVKYFLDHANPQSQLILYTDKPIDVKNSGVILRSGRYPDLHIVDFSHYCLPISPENPHYGQKGDYIKASFPNATHTIYGEFTSDQLLLNNIKLKLHLSENKYSRLTYNPDFDFVCTKITEFTHTLI